MSYILDALEKSEKERVRKRTPNLDHDGEPHSISIKWALAILLVFAIVNSVGVYLYFGDRSTSPGLDPATLNVEPETTDLPTLGSPLDTDNAVATVLAEEPATRSVTVADVTAHIYASDPALRMVKINGIARGEGDLLAPGHRLIEITESGVVLELDGGRYALNVMADWQSD